MAASAAWKPRTTKPFDTNREGGPASTSPRRASQYPRRPAGRSPIPSRTPLRASVSPRMARSMATHHSTQASPASGSACVSPEIAIAWLCSAPSSPRQASATGAVRMRLPLPALLLGCSAKWRAAAVATPVGLEARERTARVWMPTSAGPESYQSRKRLATAVGSSVPVADSSAMHNAIWVSSVHSPGSQPPRPPPIIAASPCGGEPNS
jgi:hypothetical protein